MADSQNQKTRSLAFGDEPVVLKESLPKPSISTVTSPKVTAQDATTQWNTNKLGLRLGSDALAAGAAGALVAPIITIIDKGIIENASGRNTLGESLKKSARELLLKPHVFLRGKPFVLIFVRLPAANPQARARASWCESSKRHKLTWINRVCTSAPTSPQTRSTRYKA